MAHSRFKTSQCPAVFALSILNMNYTVDTLINYAFKNKNDLALLCSGEKGKISLRRCLYSRYCSKVSPDKTLRFEFSDSAKL